MKSSNVSISLSTSGTATGAGVDYTLLSPVIIPAGQLTTKVDVKAIEDLIDENNETVIVDISSVTNADGLGTQQVAINIVDNDNPPVSLSLFVDKDTISEYNETATVTARLSAVYDQDYTLQTANPLFDMTVGLYVSGNTVQNAKTAEDTAGKLLFASQSLMMREKVDIYRQHAASLLGDSSDAFFAPFNDDIAS